MREGRGDRERRETQTLLPSQQVENAERLLQGTTLALAVICFQMTLAAGETLFLKIASHCAKLQVSQRVTGLILRRH